MVLVLGVFVPTERDIFMIKKVMLILALAVPCISIQAAELVEIKDVPADVALVSVEDASSTSDLIMPEQPAGVLAWFKQHKVATIVLVATALSATAVAGTLYVSPTARQKAQEVLTAVGKFVKHEQKAQPAA